MIEYSTQNRFGSSNHRAAHAYAQTHVASGTPDATPHQLILMLLDGALASIGQAQSNIAANNIAEKNAASSKALRILEEGLRASLDRGNGGVLAQKLDLLYDYMTRRLLMANLKNDAQGFAEVGDLLRDIRAGWEGIAAEVNAGVSVQSDLKNIQ
jgi:flagellar protein FliS